MKIKTTLLVLLSPILIFAQVGMGQWRTHFSYNKMSHVEETSEAVFGISDGALFSISKEDNLVETYSKINGQSDFSVSAIKYNKTTEKLMIMYSNGNIDLLADDDIENIPDIKNKSISASKTPNDILFKNELAYVSCAIGIIVVNLSKNEVTDTYIIGTNSSMVAVNSTAILGDSIYALTDLGLYVANKNNQLLVDYNNWQYRSNSILSSSTNKTLVVFNNKIYLLKENGTIYSSTDAVTWTTFDTDYSYKGIRTDDTNLIIYSNNEIKRYDSNLSVINYSGISTTDVVYNNSDNIYWIASADSTGILKMQNGTIINSYKPDGPVTNMIFDVSITNNRLYAITGGKWETQNLGVTGAIMMMNDDESWTNIVQSDVDKYAPGKPFTDLTNIAVDPSDQKHYFVSTYGNGMFEFKNDAFNYRYSGENSSLENSQGSAGWCITDGVIFDENNNLWLTNDVTPSSLKILNKDGSWTLLNYFPISSSNSFDQILITENGYKWLNRPRGGGVFILDDNNDPSTTYNHQFIEYSSVTKPYGQTGAFDQDGNSLQLNNVFCITKDLNDEVWIGTEEGPVIFNNIDEVFDDDYTLYRPKIPRNDGTNYADYLLEGDEVLSIAVDGANRKWIGTANSGVYLMSEDGLETIKHFTTENSPILSDRILSIAINNETGEVFLATDMGLISYMSDASLPSETYESINIYPNPVRSTFNGVITITDLVENTLVKITDTNGRIVYQTRANGGIATWSGYTLNGVKASTGVYFVMVSNASSSNTENIQTAVGKILIVK